MSHTQSQKIPYRCWEDCQPNGCPGHVLECNYSNTSDVATFSKDGKPIFYVDPNQWQAMKTAAAEVQL